MIVRQVQRILFLFSLLLLIGNLSFAQTDPIEHTWYNEAKTGKVTDIQSP